MIEQNNVISGQQEIIDKLNKRVNLLEEIGTTCHYNLLQSIADCAKSQLSTWVLESDFMKPENKNIKY